MAVIHKPGTRQFSDIDALKKSKAPPNWQDLLYKETCKIGDDRIRKLVEVGLEKAPGYFWYVPASLTGKYHPDFSQGEGGLIRHIKAVCYFVDDFCNNIDYFGQKKNFDKIYAAAILHDLFKYGEQMERQEYNSHGSIAALKIHEFGKGIVDDDVLLDICNNVMHHLGKWEVYLDIPWRDPIKRYSWSILQISDIVSSRKPIDLKGLW